MAVVCETKKERFVSRERLDLNKHTGRNGRMHEKVSQRLNKKTLWTEFQFTFRGFCRHCRTNMVWRLERKRNERKKKWKVREDTLRAREIFL